MRQVKANKICDYFFKIWINSQLDSCRNAVLKKITIREKLGLGDFVETIESTLEKWSNSPEQEEQAAVPKIRRELYYDAYQLKQHLVYLELINNSYVSWKRYLEFKSTIRIIQPSTIWPNSYVCNFFDGVKKRHCKHSLMVMCMNGLFSYPPDVTAKPLKRRQKSGRPTLASSALSRI
uniref:SWIM-type domain-containing protein n=1 Tax=Ditylenchus dipsaci TaxID=166011 RepID=A0A915EFL5_9BILA